MEIPSGIFGLLRVLFKPIADFVSKVFFYRAYEISTLYRNHRELFRIPPNNLTNDIEFRVYWKEYHLRRKLITPMIWVRAKGDEVFSKLVLSVTASNNKIKYQDYVTILNVNNTPTQTSLPSIPFRKLKIRDGTAFTPYDDIRTHLLEAYDQAGDTINLFGGNETRLTPIDKLEVELGLEKGDVEKWGEIFNLEFIELEIKEQRIRLIGRRIMRRDVFSRIVVRLFELNWLVKIIFWSRNIFTAKQLTKEFDRCLKDHEEFKQRNEKQDDNQPSLKTG